MASIEKMLLYYSIFAAALTASLTNGQLQAKIVTQRKVDSVPYKYLRGHVFKTTTDALDPQHCMADCWEENERCESFNLLFLLRKCELNDATNVTNPEDFIDRPDSVYLTNPVFGREPKPVMARHTNSYPPIDPCSSNPCQNAESCVQDLMLGYRCEQCHAQYRGPKCEEHVDPCISTQCQNGGTCISEMTSWRCACLYPYIGKTCGDISNDYAFELDGSGDYPYSEVVKRNFQQFTLNFWFKTAEPNTSYFIHHTPELHGEVHTLAVWRSGNTFFVQLRKDHVHVYNFTFPYSYPVNNNHWRVVTIVLKTNAELSFYLDGVMREPAKLTAGTPGSDHLFILGRGILRLGYFKDSDGNEHFLNGSIGSVDIKGAFDGNYRNIYQSIFKRCIPGFLGVFEKENWVGLSRLARRVNCSTRTPVMGIYSYYFKGMTQSLEHIVSPPKDLTAFTMIFQTKRNNQLVKPAQIACYGNEGEDCRFSVVINANFTLGIVIESTQFNVDLLPFNDYLVHFFIITWTNVGGVFQLIIDGILQSTLLGIETNGKISGQGRFITGSNHIDYIHNMNIWDEVLSDEMLLMMAAQPGDDMGNVVAWKDFKTPDPSIIVPKIIDFRVKSIGVNNFQVDFPQTPAYIQSSAGCCAGRTVFTLAMWLKLTRFPATIFSVERVSGEEPTSILLKVLSDGAIKLSLKGENASLGSIPVESLGVHFLAISWSNGGDLHINLNGVPNHVSTNFAQGLHFAIERTGRTTIGSEQGQETILGSVSQVNFWLNEALPPPALMALSRGMNGIAVSGDVQWARYLASNSRKGKTQLIHPVLVYTPDFTVLKKRDQYCNDMRLPEGCSGRRRARLGRNAILHFAAWGCFCEEDLSKDMNNDNYGSGDYSRHSELADIN